MDERRKIEQHASGHTSPVNKNHAQRRRKEMLRRKRQRKMRRRRLVCAAIVLFAAAVVFLVLFIGEVQESKAQLRVQRQLQNVFEQSNVELQTTPPENIPEATAVAESTMIVATPEIPDATVSQEVAVDNFVQTASTEDPFALMVAVDATATPRTKPFISDRLAELWETNSDLIGWISVGQDISTPVVYRDNEYYMNHDFYGNESAAGTIFVDVKNVNWQVDQYRIFYGHNMKNDTMFGMLDLYKDEAYFRANPFVEFHSVYNNEVQQYVIFAAMEASVQQSSKNYFFLRRYDIYGEDRNDADIAEFLEEIKQRSAYAIDVVDVDVEDKIICLVTCSYNLTDARFMIFARELRADETMESVQSLIQAYSK